MDKNLPTLLADSADILKALKTVLALPDCVSALELSLKLGEPPTVSCTFHPFSKE